MADHDITKPLRILSAHAGEYDEDRTVLLKLDRPPTDAEVAQLAKLPPSFVVAADLRTMIERAMLMELALRVTNTYVLAGFQMPEGPAVVRWIRDWMSGTNPPHGPLGGRMIWPANLMGLCNLLRDWGYSPTEQTRTEPSFVTRSLLKPKAGGAEPEPIRESSLFLPPPR